MCGVGFLYGLRHEIVSTLDTMASKLISGPMHDVPKLWKLVIKVRTSGEIVTVLCRVK